MAADFAAMQLLSWNDLEEEEEDAVDAIVVQKTVFSSFLFHIESWSSQRNASNRVWWYTILNLLRSRVRNRNHGCAEQFAVLKPGV